MSSAQETLSQDDFYQDALQGGSRVTVIESRPAWFGLNFSEIWRYRYLIWLYIYRDFVVLYKQTVLGMVWWLLQPFLMMIVFSIVFGKIVGIKTDAVPVPIFYLSGITIWNYFLYCFLHTSQTFIDNRDVFKKVYFPRLVIPFAAIASNLMRFVLQLSMLIFFYILFIFLGASVRPMLYFFIFFPLITIYVALFAFGVGILTASLTTKYRDIILALPFFTQLWMFGSVVVFPMSLVSEKWQFIFALNPMVMPLELFRHICFGTNFSVPIITIIVNILTTIFVLLLGIFAFNNAERNFTDTI